MNEADTILRMIETVSMDNKATLNEIDARTHDLLYNTESRKNMQGPHWNHKDNRGYWVKAPKYTRSRDALKEIRPQGWRIRVYQDDDGFYCHLNKYFGLDNILWDASSLPIEEMAELHVVIRAIQYEREHA